MKRRIAALRLSVNMTPGQLATKAGVTARDLYNIEHDIPVSESIIGRVCNTLAVPRHDVLVASSDWREKRL